MSNANSYTKRDLSNNNKSGVVTPLSPTRHKRFSFSLIATCLIFFMILFLASNSNSSQKFAMDPEDMVQNGIYYFGDHGSGMQIAQFDRMEGNNVYTYSSIRPSTLTFQGAGLWGTVANTGLIRFATLDEIAHLLACILAGVYVP